MLKLNFWVIPGLKHRPSIRPDKREDPHRIALIVCERFGVEYFQLLRRGKTQDVTWPRFVIAFLLREYTTLSDESIATFINRNRSMVTYSSKKVRDALDINQDEMREDIAWIESRIVTGYHPNQS